MHNRHMNSVYGRVCRGEIGWTEYPGKHDWIGVAWSIWNRRRPEQLQSASPKHSVNGKGKHKARRIEGPPVDAKAAAAVTGGPSQGYGFRYSILYE